MTKNPRYFSFLRRIVGLLFVITAIIVALPGTVARAADYTWNCTADDPTPGWGNTDDRSYQTVSISGTITISVSGCTWAYTSGSVSPSGSGTYIGGTTTVYTVTGNGSINVYVAGVYGYNWTFTAPADTIAPTLSTSTPTDDANGVGINANLTLNFSENVSAVAAKNVVIKKASDNSNFESIAANDATKVTVSGSTVTINPAGTFDYSTSYYVLIDSGAFKDAANNVYTGISSSTALNFTSVADTTAPTLSSSTPADNATSVALNSNIALTFSEPVTAVAAKNIVIKKSDGTTVETISVTSSQVTVSGSSVTINPANDFDYSVGYYVLIDSGAFKDAANNVYAGISSSTALNFTSVADTTAPTLSSSTPADNATSVALNSNIALTFSEPVTAVAAKNIVIKKSDGTTVETISVTSSQVTVSGSSVTINPANDFDYSVGYYVLIDSGAFKDAANNVYAGISSSTALNFTSVADTTAPTLSSSTPADNATGVATASNISLTFSETVTAVSGKNILIKKSDGTTVETISTTDGSRVSISGSTVTVNPTTAFEYSMSYYVLIDAGAFRDAASNSFAGISSSAVFNFTVVAETTTTTVAPAPTSTSVVTAPVNSVVAVSPSTTVVKGSSPKSTTTTSSSIVSRSTPTTSVAAPIATSTTSSTTTTTSVPAVVAPDAPEAEPGSATAVVNGKEVSLTVTRVNNKIEVTAGALQIRIGVRDENGNTVSLDADGNAVVEDGSQIEYSISGARPGEELEAWLFSDPIKLATAVIGDKGQAEGLLMIKDKVPSGPHRLVLKTMSSSGEDATIAIGVIAGARGEGVSVSRIIFGILIAATLAGLIIPATRRRRRVREAA